MSLTRCVFGKLPQFIGLKDIGAMMKMSSVDVANLKRSQSNFPLPFAEISGYPAYDTVKVIHWFNLNNIEYDLSQIKCQSRKDIDKHVNVIGLESAGKTRFVSKLSAHEHVLRECFKIQTSTKTKIVHKFIIKKHCPEPMCCIKFVSPNSSLDGIRAPLEIFPILELYKKIENENYNTMEAGGGPRELDPHEDILEIYTSASPLAVAILEDDDDGVIVYDTPSLTSNSWPCQVSNSGAFLLMLNDNLQFVSGKVLANNIHFLFGAKLAVVSRIDDTIDSQRGYRELKKKAENMSNIYFNSVKNNINTNLVASKTFCLLQTNKPVTLMGSFKLTGMNQTEQFFDKDIAKVLRPMLSHHTPLEDEIYIADMLNKKQNDLSAIRNAKEYLTRICSNAVKSIPIHRHGAYNQHAYLNEGHLGTTHNNGHAAILSIRKSIAQIQKKVYNKFIAISASKDTLGFSLEEQEQLIAFCYKKLHMALNTDCGIAHGYHDHESSPPIALWVHESVVADKLAEIGSFNLAVPETMSLSDAYVGVMSKLFFSKTWGYVKIRPPYTGRVSYCNRKIEILARCRLFELAAESTDVYISNCYCVGLLMLGAFSVLNYFTEAYSLVDDDVKAVGRLADLAR